MRTALMELSESACVYIALLALSRELSKAFEMAVKFRRFDTGPDLSWRFQLYCLLAATFEGNLSPQQWDVGFYLERATLPAVRRALESLAA